MTLAEKWFNCYGDELRPKPGHEMPDVTGKTCNGNEDDCTGVVIAVLQQYYVSWPDEYLCAVCLDYHQNRGL